MMATPQKLFISEAAILKGWHYPATKLWHVPLQAKVSNLNMHTLLIDGPTVFESLNAL